MNSAEENITLIVNEPQTELDRLYEKAELDQLREALKRTYKERFLVMTRLMKMNEMFRKAKITHTPTS
ncbi:hypothetical protein AH06_00075 [candidate division TM6 bacterium Zodletone_IIa]|jgi:hypothetical protein|nr:hypothetical protein AH06_00075 [candidate division TM6 bacterium Zodletone_IIa]